MPYVSVHVDTEDVLEELDDDELIEELERRQCAIPYIPENLQSRMTQAYELHVRGRTEQAQAILYELMLETVNRVV